MKNEKMQLTGWENANNMRNAKCAGTQTSMEWPYCSFLYCGNINRTYLLFWLIEETLKCAQLHVEVDCTTLPVKIYVDEYSFTFSSCKRFHWKFRGKVFKENNIS